MMQSIRSAAQTTGFRLFVFLIVMSFAGFGLEQVLFGGSGTSVAEVNGTEITPQELQVAIDTQKRQLAQIFGDNIDPAMLEDDRLRPRALDELIERTVLLQAATTQNMVASNRAIGQIVAGIEAFQLDGRFNADQYKVVLANAGYTPERFRRDQAQQLILTQLQQGVLDTDFVTQTELMAAAQATAEERDVRYLIIPRATLADSITITDESVQQAYDRQPERWVSEEAVIADYILVAQSDFLEPVDPDVLEEQFESVKSEYTVAEQALISHILLIQGDGEASADYARRVDDVASRIADGEDFAELASTLSDDIGSASLGGELGFTDGTTFPEPMELAIAELAVGDVSAPVETDAGIHFIRVDERVAGETPDYEALRAELAESIQAAEAQQSLLVTVDELRELSFNAADLQQPAEVLSLDVKRSGAITRSAGDDIFAQASVREALFSEEVYGAGNNSAVLELSDNRFVVARVAERQEARALPLDEVAADIRAELEANALMAAEAALLESLQGRRQAGERLEEIANTEGYEWRVELGARRSGGLLPPEVSDLAFRLQLSDEPTLSAVSLGEEELAVVELAAVELGSLEGLPMAERDMMARQLTDLQGQLSLLEYRSALRANAEIVTR